VKLTHHDNYVSVWLAISNTNVIEGLFFSPGSCSTWGVYM